MVDTTEYSLWVVQNSKYAPKQIQNGKKQKITISSVDKPISIKSGMVMCLGRADLLFK